MKIFKIIFIRSFLTQMILNEFQREIVGLKLFLDCDVRIFGKLSFVAATHTIHACVFIAFQFQIDCYVYWG